MTVTPELTCFWQVSPNRNSLSFDTWVCLTPFLSFFMKEIPKDIPHIPLIYVLNLVNASISYFFSYKSTLLFVHQQKYVETAIRAAVSLAAVGAQIGVLLLTRNYLYYLFHAIAATVVQNAAVSLQADRLYPYLREKDIRPLPEEALGEIRRNVRAMLLHRIGAVAVFNTDNLLISKFAGVASAGLYSNYTMIRGFLNILVSALFDAITPALGNLTATEPEESKRTAFRRLSFFSAWLFGWMSICLFCLYDPFIDLWLGEGYLLSKPAVLLIAVNFYVNGMRTPVNNTKSVLGLFWDDRYKSIVEAACNLAVSVLLARRWGVAGIMAGTLVSTLAFPFWCEPLVLYRRGAARARRGVFPGILDSPGGHRGRRDADLSAVRHDGERMDRVPGKGPAPRGGAERGLSGRLPKDGGVPLFKGHGGEADEKSAVGPARNPSKLPPCPRGEDAAGAFGFAPGFLRTCALRPCSETWPNRGRRAEIFPVRPGDFRGQSRRMAEERSAVWREADRPDSPQRSGLQVQRFFPPRQGANSRGAMSRTSGHMKKAAEKPIPAPRRSFWFRVSASSKRTKWASPFRV